MSNGENSTQVAQGDDLFDEDDRQTLAANRVIRKTLIRALTDGGKVPEANADKSLLIGLMDGVDREILTRARLKIAAKTEDNTSNMTAMVAHILRNHTVKPTNTPVERNLDLPSDIVVTNPIPGERDEGLVPVTYDDFMKTNAAQA